MSQQKKDKASFPTYKGKPLVRCGDTIYYGSMQDKYVIKLDIKSKKKVGDLDVADKVVVQLMYTDPEIRTRKQIVKTSEKEGLYLALDIADAWLTRAGGVKENKKKPPPKGGQFLFARFRALFQTAPFGRRREEFLRGSDRAIGIVIGSRLVFFWQRTEKNTK